MFNDCLDQSEVGNGKKWIHLDYMLKIESIGPVDELDVCSELKNE